MITKKNVFIIGSVGVPACYGGFETLVENILDYTPTEVQYTVVCSAERYETKLDSYKGAKLYYINRNANGKSSILYDFESMKLAIKNNADIMLILGVSGCIFLPYIRKKFNGRIITNIDGLEWKRDKWTWYAKFILHYSEKQAVKYSDIIIGDNKGIIDYVEKAYNKKAQLIAYGGDNVEKVTDDSLYSKYPFCKEPYAVTVCRIEPENNIQIILEAFTKLPNEQLIVVGNWNHGDYSKRLREKYSSFSNLHLLDPIYETHTINWIRSNASVYVHGHSAGGTNPSLVEAMNFGLPILAFDCVYNRATTKDECLYWNTPDELIKLLTNKSQLGSLGIKMKEIGAKEYTWHRIAEQYNSLY